MTNLLLLNFNEDGGIATLLYCQIHLVAIKDSSLAPPMWIEFTNEGLTVMNCFVDSCIRIAV